MNLKKARLPFFYLIFFLFFELQAQLPKSLLGLWEIRMQAGGLKGGVKHYPKGNGNRVQFSLGEFKYLYEDKVIDKGKYSLLKKKCFQSGQMETFIQFKPGGQPIQYCKVHLDSLFLNTDADDGIRYIYIRVH